MARYDNAMRQAQSQPAATGYGHVQTSNKRGREEERHKGEEEPMAKTMIRQFLALSGTTKYEQEGGD